MPVTDLPASGEDYPGFDAAWQTRIPQGWVQFPDGSWGPPNAASPFDQAWQTRVQPTPGPLAQPGAQPPSVRVGGMPSLGPGRYGNLRVVDVGAGQGGVAAPGGAQDYGYYGDAGPQPYQRGQPAPDVAAPGARGGWPGGAPAGAGNVFGTGRGAPMGGPEYLDDVVRRARAGIGWSSLAGVASRINPILAGLVAAMTPTPVDTGELPTYLSGQRPQHPPSTGRMPIPMGMPGRAIPFTGLRSPSGPQGAPSAAAPSAAPSAAAPSVVTTNRPGLPYGPRFRPQTSAAPPAAPYLLGGESRAVGVGQNPLAYDPYYFAAQARRPFFLGPLARAS